MDFSSVATSVADAEAAAASGANTVVLLWRRRDATRPSRRAAALALALLNAGVLAQAIASQTLAPDIAGGGGAGAELWLATRVLLAAGALAISLLLIGDRR